MTNGIGERIRELRVARSLSQVELAARSGVNAVTISGIERGGNTTLATLVKLAAALQVPVAGLVPLRADEEIAAIKARVELELRTLVSDVASSVVDEVADALRR